MVTPFDQGGAIDPVALAGLVADVVASGLDIIVVTGGVGELAALDLDEQVRIWEAAVEGAVCHAAVLAGIGALRTTQSELPDVLAAVARADRAGVDGILLFPSVAAASDGEELASFVAAVIAATALPVVLDHGAVPTTPEATARALDRSAVAGVKYSGADLDEWAALRRACGERAGLAWLAGAGDDVAPGFVARGANAYSSSMANLCPDLVVQMSRALIAGDIAIGEELALRMQPLAALRSRPGRSVTVLKAAMTRAGRPAGGVRGVGAADLGATEEELDRALAALGPPRGPIGNRPAPERP
jgi:dihydrodipicolinate synthase/N-acetylneuraminate lyase